MKKLRLWKINFTSVRLQKLCFLPFFFTECWRYKYVPYARRAHIQRKSLCFQNLWTGGGTRAGSWQKKENSQRMKGRRKHSKPGRCGRDQIGLWVQRGGRDDGNGQAHWEWPGAQRDRIWIPVVCSREVSKKIQHKIPKSSDQKSSKQKLCQHQAGLGETPKQNSRMK